MTTTSTTTANDAVTSIINAGTSLYTEISGKSLTTDVSNNISAVATIASLCLSLIEQKVSVDLNTILSSVGNMIEEGENIAKVIKASTTSTTSTTATATK